MIASVLSGQLYSISSDESITAGELTITLPTQVGVLVFAEVALTALSQGAQISIANDAVTGTPGAAKVRIKSFARMSDAGLVLADAAPDTNRLVVNRCLEVTFRLATMLAEAHAVATVYTLVPSGEMRMVDIKLQQLVALVYERNSGLARYTHRFTAPSGARLPSKSRIEREALSTASAFLQVPRSRLGTVVVAGNRVKTAAYQVNPSTKAIRRAAGIKIQSGTVRPGLHQVLARA